jgi:hypothetical protein
VQRLGALAVRQLDLLGGGVGFDAEHIVRIREQSRARRMRETTRTTTLASAARSVNRGGPARASERHRDRRTRQRDPRPVGSKHGARAASDDVRQLATLREASSFCGDENFDRRAENREKTDL